MRSHDVPDYPVMPVVSLEEEMQRVHNNVFAVKRCRS
jgi:hypothetical protein